MKENLPALTVKDWLLLAKRKIPVLDAELILCDVLKLGDRSGLVLKEDDFLTSGARTRADKMAAKRQNGEPLAYILGYKEFFGRSFLVTPAVLVPRPETEDVVRLALEVGGKDLQTIEIGVGSSCIATTLSLELGMEVWATDVSDAALKIAARNIRAHNAKVKLKKSDLLAEVDFPKDKGVLLVANLPYVDKDWEWVSTDALKYEPEVALYANNGGLELVYKLLDQFRDKCCKKYNNFMILETDTSQQADVIEFARNLGIKHRKTEGFAMLFEY